MSRIHEEYNREGDTSSPSIDNGESHLRFVIPLTMILCDFQINAVSWANLGAFSGGPLRSYDDGAEVQRTV